MPTPSHRRESFLDRRYPHIVGSYLLALSFVVAGLIFFPFSSVLMGLLFFLVGLFFLVPIGVVSAILFSITVEVSGVVRRTLRSAHSNGKGSSIKSEDGQHNPGLAGGRSDLWDRWLDES